MFDIGFALLTKSCQRYWGKIQVSLSRGFRLPPAEIIPLEYFLKLFRANLSDKNYKNCPAKQSFSSI